MYIARRTGQGRGVYEVAGQTASGIGPSDLVNRPFVLEFDDGTLVPLGVSLSSQGGKPRLVLAGGEIHVQRQLAALLLLPKPRRDNHKWSEEYKAPTRETYVVEQVQLAFVNHTHPSGAVRVVPDVMSLRNAAGEWFIEVDNRLRDIEYVWAHSSKLSAEIRSLVVQHQRYVMAQAPIPAECEKVVSSLSKLLGPDDDPLAVLMAMVGESAGETAVERVWKQIAQRRGQRYFREALIDAYQGTCQVTDFTGVEALEAAHIVPYASGGEQANDPANGLLLRADIHTLFDLNLLKIDPNNLRIRIMEPLHKSSYMRYHDSLLRTGSQIQPSVQALATRWDQQHHGL